MIIESSNRKLDINLSNCFGIGELNHSFELSKGNTLLIYAPNGTMKTSLARTFLCLEDNHNALDLLDEYSESLYSFILNGKIITSDQVYVYKTEDNQLEPNSISGLEEKNLLSLLSAPDLVDRFNELKMPLDLLLEQIGKKFKHFISYGKISFSEEIIKLHLSDGILEVYDSIYRLFLDSPQYDLKGIDFKEIFYNDIFDEHGTSIKYIKKYYDNLLYLNGKNRNEVIVDNERRWEILCNIVDSNPKIKEILNDLDLLRKEYILYFIRKNIDLFQSFCNQYKKTKDELLFVIAQINSDTELWDKVILKFNCRFHMPYRLYLDNKADALLNKDFLRIRYYNKIVSKEYRGKEAFLNFISTGEKRAYYLLLNLFEIEKRKQRNEQQIIVIDDIIDSFDYKNKYAIVEYLAELRKQDNFILLILTHNFDFYRTISSRLGINNIFIASKDEKRNITLQDGCYTKDIFKNVIIKNLHQLDCLIASIPFVRNIVEYTKGGQSDEYKALCSYLHYRQGTESLSLDGLYKLISANILCDQKISNHNGNYLAALKLVADTAFISNDEISIVNKLVLSIAIRLKAEEFVYKKIDLTKDTEFEKVNNYTFTLFEKYQQEYPLKTENHSTLSKVIMMTSENIHLNNFMFEPIIDLSLEYLKDLYIEIKSLK